MIVSFAWTTPALLRGEKTATSREWSDRYLEQWQNAYARGDRRHQAWDKSPRAGGKQVGWITLTKPPIRKRLRDFTDEEVYAEALYGGRDGPRITTITQMLVWMEAVGIDPDGVVTLLRFTFTPLDPTTGKES